MTSRGIRNNNPGNIRHGEPWQGLSKEQTDASFCQFISPEYGIRAIAKILQSYNKRNINSVQDIINAWAPSIENDTEAYTEAVCKACDFNPVQHIDMTDKLIIECLVKAIIQHENGSQPYSEQTITDGINLAFN